MSHAARMTGPVTTVPFAARALGWAGVIPFAGGAGLAITNAGGWGATGLAALVAYGAIILAFMGGVQWGVGMSGAARERDLLAPLAISVVPALIGFLATFLSVRPGLLLLAAGFVGLLLYDLGTVRSGRAPGWYGRLRIELTAAVATLLLCAVVLAR